MKLGYFDCRTGISGDMILGAIVDCGADFEEIKDRLAVLPIQGYELSKKQVNKKGLSATQVEVVVRDQVKERRLGEILSIVEDSQLPERIKGKALEIFRRIGTVEAKIHGVESDTIHLHELGGVDTIIDVIGALIGLEVLGLDKVTASPLPLGIGMIDTAHGSIPLPAPATLELLEGVPVRGSDINKELVTPTGAAILTSVVHGFGNIPEMRLGKTGYGAGKMDLPVPNVLRLITGEEINNAYPDLFFHEEHLVCLETNIDNMNPEIYSYLTERLFDVGALDVALVPIYMKKNRPGTMIKVLCKEEDADAMMRIVLYETTTLGIRKYSVDRFSLERQVIKLSTRYGEVQVKFTKRGENAWDYAPEYEDCRRIALEKHLPIKEIYLAAERAAEEFKKTHN
jgi:pyridinium-3,5-bisthiocarboxylic acid mononucleotide nickel chelatase